MLLFYCSLYTLATADIFTAVENGVDVFDGSCAYSATERGCAMVFPIVHDQKLQRLNHGMDYDKTRDVRDTVEPIPFEIDLSEERYTRRM